MQSLPAMFETNGAIARSFGDLFAYDLPADYYRALPARLAAVSASTLKPLAQRYLDPTTMVIVAVGDRRKLQASSQDPEYRRDRNLAGRRMAVLTCRDDR